MSDYSANGAFGDWREVRGRLFKIRDQLDKSVNDPGVKEDIYIQVYDSGIPNQGVPVDTQALALSPTTGFTPTPMGKGRYAFGGIDGDGIHYNPYGSKTETSGDKYYAQAAMSYSGWNPKQNMRDDIAQGYGNSVILEIVKQALMGELKDG